MSSDSDNHNEDEDLKQAIEDEDDKYQEIVKIKNGRVYNTTFISRHLQSRNNPAQTITAHIPRSCTKTTPPLWYKKILIDKLHSRTGSIAEFKRKHTGDRNGYSKYLATMSVETLKNYCKDYKKTSDNYLQLEKFVNEHTQTELLNKYRFYFSPNEEKYGLFPILEEYIVTFRNYIAQSSQFRSKDWMQQNLRFILNNKRLLDLLKPLMKSTELNLLPNLKVSRKFIYRIQVCSYHFEYYKKKYV